LAETHPSPDRPATPAIVENYTLACPDLLEVGVEGRQDLGGRAAITTDGCLELNGLGKLRVEGRTLVEVADTVAEQAGVSAQRVHVRVVEFRSQKIYLFGEGNGLQRAVAYQGPETVLELLQRTGAMRSGAAVGKVYVVRSHILEGQSPEVFHLDPRAIVRDKDERTNPRLQPFDQVYVGETHQSCVRRCIPHWMRPLYSEISRMNPPKE